MANKDHLKILKQGTAAWNLWRENNPDIQPDLREIDISRLDLNLINFRRVDLRESNLSNVNLSEADLKWSNLMWANLNSAYLKDADIRWANLSQANLQKSNLNRVKLIGATLKNADFRFADLKWADLRGVNLRGGDLRFSDLSQVNFNIADLRGANFSKANLEWVNLNSADLSGANLKDANLSGVNLVETNFEKANITGCRIYGISAWNLKLDEAKQADLIITRPNEPTITVDNLEVAQFIYLLLNNEKIRGVIDTISRKVVLILGRFTSNRKDILNEIRYELRKNDYLPILFDFEKPATRDMTETVRTLAHLARFIIADITEPRSIPHELQAIVPDIAVPIQPLLLKSSTGEYSMFQDLSKYHWVLPIHRYDNLKHLIGSLREKVIMPSEAKAKELETKVGNFELSPEQNPRKT